MGIEIFKYLKYIVLAILLTSVNFLKFRYFMRCHFINILMGEFNLKIRYQQKYYQYVKSDCKFGIFA